MPYPLTLTLTLALCFAVQALALRLVGGRTSKSESNYFSSVARIQTGIKGSPEVMLLGSSMTGRFPDRREGFDGVASLGCDGGSAVDTLEAMRDGLLPAAPVLIIEGNTLYRSLSGAPTEISSTMRSPWFRVGCEWPLLGASARPSAFGYSVLLSRKIGVAEGPEGAALATTTQPACPDEPPLGDDRQERFAQDLAETLRVLAQRGSQCMIVVIPPGIVTDKQTEALPRRIANLADIPYWNMTEGLSASDWKLTDGVHLAPKSAAMTLRALLKPIHAISRTRQHDKTGETLAPEGRKDLPHGRQ